jgi:hypothetical protein
MPSKNLMIRKLSILLKTMQEISSTPTAPLMEILMFLKLPNKLL